MNTNENDLDLRPFILAVIRKWWLILLLIIIAAAGAYLFSIQKSDTYQATNTILLTRSRSVLSLAEQFPTVTENPDRRSRIEAILAIARSDAIALATYNALDDDQLPEEFDWVKLRGKVEVVASGDAVLVTASINNPDLAAEIANVWAEEAVQAINLAYSGEQSIEEIQSQLIVAQRDYDSAQVNLEAFVQSNQIAASDIQIKEGKELYSHLTENHYSEIIFYSDRIQAMDELIVQSEGLKKQLEGGNASSAGDVGDALAVLKIRAEGMNLSSMAMDTDQLPVSTYALQFSNFDVIVDTSVNYVADLETIIQLARDEKEKAETILSNMAGGIYIEEDSLLEQVNIQILEAETQLLSEQTQIEELISERDLAWQAYQALAQKETELISGAQTSSMFTIASSAIPPENPVSQGAERNALLAGAVGLALGVFLALVFEWWRSSEI
jgi:capsular polysaccharide biosynthesis protein